jgi:hypothetical protein
VAGTFTRRKFLKLGSLAAAGGWTAPINKALNLSRAATLEKSKLNSSDSYLPLVRVVWKDGTKLHLVRSTDDVVFDAGDGDGPVTYTAFAWDFAELQEKSDGSVPSWAIRVSNVQRVVESLLEGYSGGEGAELTVFVVLASNLAREPELELDFDITGSEADSRWVTLTLGAQSPLRILFNRHTYSADVCNWRYKGPECTYTGTLPGCSFRLGGPVGCRAHFPGGRGTALPFGAYPGIDSNGLRVVTK